MVGVNLRSDDMEVAFEQRTQRADASVDFEQWTERNIKIPSRLQRNSHRY